VSAIELQPNLAKRLEGEAHRRQVTLESLVNEWLEEQWWQAQHEKIRRETEQYQAQHGQLRALYLGKVIAMHEGNVIVVGEDMGQVYLQAQDKVGDDAVLVIQVQDEPVESYRVRTPQLVTHDL
jgi:hypothetical protein